MLFYNPDIRSLYVTGEYPPNLGRHTNAHFGLKYNGGIFVGVYSSYYGPISKLYLPGTDGVFCPTNSDPITGTTCSIHKYYTVSTSPE